jgi:hypothetical protein
LPARLEGSERQDRNRDARPERRRDAGQPFDFSQAGLWPQRARDMIGGERISIRVGSSGCLIDFPAEFRRMEPRARHIAARVDQSEESRMSKGLDQKKSDKKKPEKTMKEKRAEKKEKKAAKGR